MGINSNTASRDSWDKDAFSRARVSESQTVFDSQQTIVFDGQKLWDGLVDDNGTPVFLPKTVGAFVTGINGSAIGVSPSGLDQTTRLVSITLNNTFATSKCIVQSKEYSPYTAGKSQLVLATGIFAPQTSPVNQNVRVVMRTSVRGSPDDDFWATSQANWNIDTLDGSGSINNPSKITLDLTKTQILELDAEMLYVGRVRIGFSIGGIFRLVHEFLNANINDLPTVQTFTLPMRYELANESNRAVSRCGYFDKNNGVFLEVSDDFVTSTATIQMKCNSVQTEGGKELRLYNTAVNRFDAVPLTTTEIPLISVRPKELFNGIENRIKLFPIKTSISNTGLNTILFSIVHGATITGDAWDTSQTDKSYEENITPISMSGGRTLTTSIAAAPGGGNAANSGEIMEVFLRLSAVLSKIDNELIEQQTLTLSARTTTGSSGCEGCVLNVEELYI